MKQQKAQLKTLAAYLNMDFRRAFLSGRFLAAVLSIPVIDLISAVNEMELGMDVFRMLDRIRSFGLCFFIYVIYTVPYAYSYCADISNRFIGYSLIRGSRVCYVKSKVLTCAVSAGSAAFLGRLCTIFLLSLRMPFWGELAGSGDEFYYEMAAEGELWKVFLILLALNFLEAALFSVIAFMVSTWTPNIFLVAASPIAGYELLINIIWLFTNSPLVSISKIYSLSGTGIFSSGWGTVLYALFFTVLSVYVMEKLSGRAIIRRLYNE